jgi:hypothetical protein
MATFDPLRSLTMRTWVAVRLACGRPNLLAMRPAAHREGVAAAQDLCTCPVWGARLQAPTGAKAGLDAMA